MHATALIASAVVLFASSTSAAAIPPVLNLLTIFQTVTKTASPRTATVVKSVTKTLTTTPACTPAPAAVAAAAAGYPADSVQGIALTQHNRLRAYHNAPLMTSNPTLVAAAQVWVNKCVYHHGGGVGLGAGENIAAWSGFVANASEGTNMWASEAYQYNTTTVVASHFTQMIWGSSTQLGCAIATCDLAVFGGASSSFMSCLYLGVGNIYPEPWFYQNIQYPFPRSAYSGDLSALSFP